MDKANIQVLHVGDIGIIVSGNTMVRYDAVEAFGNPIIVDDHDGRIAKYREVTDAAKAHGSLIIAQLSHPGRQGTKYLNPNPVSASDVHLTIKWAGNEFNKPKPLSIPEIKDMVKSWGETAYLCWKAGFDGVQGKALSTIQGSEMLTGENHFSPLCAWISPGPVPQPYNESAHRRVRRRLEQQVKNRLRDYRGNPASCH